ncbi:MAG: hypothetical protein Q7J25_07170 [Vicinamibacterales bacterium]|nr:hypothetical protein [Vicinamibacterales bacterium]
MGLSQDAEKRERQLANLEKGRVPNSGKPNGTLDLKARLRTIMLEPVESDKQKRTNAEIFVRAEVLRAQKGDRDAREMIWKLFEEDARSGSSNAVELIVRFKGAEQLPDRPADAAPEAAGVHILYRTAQGD